MHTVMNTPHSLASAAAAAPASLQVLVAPDQHDVFERARQVLASAGIQLVSATNGAAQAGFDAMRLRDVEGQLVRTAMLKARGNVSRAARALGLSRSALYRRLERHGLSTAGEVIR